MTQVGLHAYADDADGLTKNVLKFANTEISNGVEVKISKKTKFMKINSQRNGMLHSISISKVTWLEAVENIFLGVFQPELEEINKTLIIEK